MACGHCGQKAGPTAPRAAKPEPRPVPRVPKAPLIRRPTPMTNAFGRRPG